MIHSTKIGVIVRDTLQDWQKLNVTAFLSSGVAYANPDCRGDVYKDASGQAYHSLFLQPVFVYIASTEHLQRTLARAISRDITVAVYDAGMFATDNDTDNRLIVASKQPEELDLAGIAFRAESKTFDKIINGLKFHP
ncbi:MAG TPA: DUF2000 family protein [Verrucomicrobiae bacterium]|nr:DUF2000 family protein [Verrucomicrobiae bacterium]